LRRADLDGLNLAALLVDGQQVLVAAPGAAPTAPGAPMGSVPAPVTSALIDLNAADQVLLETVPGIGPVTATAILHHRGEIGSFTSIDQLLDVDGIGPATLESIRAYLTL
jgi:competence protein ComEA